MYNPDDSASVREVIKICLRLHRVQHKQLAEKLDIDASTFARKINGSERLDGVEVWQIVWAAHEIVAKRHGVRQPT